jgi:hypothetical protein
LNHSFRHSVNQTKTKLNKLSSLDNIQTHPSPHTKRPPPNPHPPHNPHQNPIMVLITLISVTVHGVSYVKKRRALKKLEASNAASTPQRRTNPAQEASEQIEDNTSPPPYERTTKAVVILEGRHMSSVGSDVVVFENPQVVMGSSEGGDAEVKSRLRLL